MISAESVKPIENFYSTFNANEANWPVMAEGVGKDYIDYCREMEIRKDPSRFDLDKNMEG